MNPSDATTTTATIFASTCRCRSRALSSAGIFTISNESLVLVFTSFKKTTHKHTYIQVSHNRSSLSRSIFGVSVCFRDQRRKSKTSRLALVGNFGGTKHAARGWSITIGFWGRSMIDLYSRAEKQENVNLCCSER